MVKRQQIIKLLPYFFSVLLLILVVFELVYFLNLKPFYYPQDLLIEFTPESYLDRKIHKLSLEEKVGLLFMVGFDEKELDEKTLAFFQKHNFNAFLLRERNIKDEKQLKQLINSLKIGSLTSLIAVDQEGGKADRINFTNIDRTSQAKIKNQEQAYQIAKTRGEILASLAIDLNFSPVLEVVRNNSAYINRSGRAFLGDEEQVFQLAKAMIRGYKERGVISVAKHFPGGLGRRVENPHQVLPVLDINKKEIEKDIYPFKKLIAEKKVRAIMVTHLLYPQIDQQYPSSLSSRFMIDILRKDLGFKGVIISDDLAMKAITNDYSIAQAAKQAFLAGADLILISSSPSDQQEAYNVILKAVQTGEISMTKVEWSLKRIIKLR